MSDVARGHMRLWDRMDPPLPQGRYHLQVDTEVTVGSADGPLEASDHYFDVEGPRFSLAPNEVAGVFPPRNARGAFDDSLPQVALGRRTLPWERPIDPPGTFPAGPPVPADPPLPAGGAPWMALLLFTEQEAEVRTNVDLSTVLPSDVHAALRPPSGLKVDALEVDLDLLQDVLPTLDELQMLTHVREVNVEDRELSAGDSDGWFAVVMANRLPAPGLTWRACLVSLEGRADVYRPRQRRPPADAHVSEGLLELVAGGTIFDPDTAPAPSFPLREADIARPNIEVNPEARFEGVLPAPAELEAAGLRYIPPLLLERPKARLVLLHHWKFECVPGKSFQELCRDLDVGLMGEVRGDRAPLVTDTGHIALEMRDRAGAEQTVWYRGPLAPYPVTRDERGPYHSADQARRVSPETGLEDISYAAAFEVGRLLAAADARLAQELMRWRRRSYRRSALASLRRDLARVLEIGAIDDLLLREDLLVPLVASQLTRRVLDPSRPIADPYDRRLVERAPGLRPELLARAWRLASPDVAATLLARHPGIVTNDAAPWPDRVAGAGAPDRDLNVDSRTLARLAFARRTALESARLREVHR